MRMIGKGQGGDRTRKQDEGQGKTKEEAVQTFPLLSVDTKYLTSLARALLEKCD